MGISKKQLDNLKQKLGPVFIGDLNKLDIIYQHIEDIDKNIKKLIKQREQLVDDSEIMEMLLMHKFNKENR